MTDAERIEMISAMTDETDPTVLSAYLRLAKQIILEKAFPFGGFPEEFPEQYDGVLGQTEIGRQDREIGLVSHC